MPITENPRSKTIPLDDGTGATTPKVGEAIAGGFGGLASVGSTLQLGRYTGWDDPQRKYGDRLYDSVDKDPVAGSSLDFLVYAALAHGLTITPAVQLEPGQTAQTPEQQADVDLSAEVAGYVHWTIDNLRTPLPTTAGEQVRSAMKYGCNVADKVWEIEPVPGVEGDQIVLKAVKPKDRKAWVFEVDAFWNIKYILGASGDGTGWQRWPREKFAVLTWGQKSGDPRGVSIFNRAVEPWNFRVQMHEVYFRFLQRFATPKVVGKLSTASMAGAAEGQADDPGQRRSFNPFTWFAEQVNKWVNGFSLVVGQEDVVEVHEVKGEGVAFGTALDTYGREIARAILLQVRATMEALHGSKADSQTGSDIVGNMIMFIRRWYCHNVEWELFYLIVAYRYGFDVADRHTPGASLGDFEHQDIADIIIAYGQAGYRLYPGQFPGLDAALKVPVRSADEIAAHQQQALAADAAARKAAADAAQQQQQQQSANQQAA